MQKAVIAGLFIIMMSLSAILPQEARAFSGDPKTFTELAPEQQELIALLLQQINALQTLLNDITSR